MQSDERYRALSDFRGQIDTYLAAGLSESDTRAKFIDALLTKVVGWEEDDLRRERTFWSDGNRAAIDYEVGLPRPLFIVEAKRLLTPFELPDSSGRTIYSLNGVIASCPALWGAITQARAYCDEWGIPFALVTNGRQYVLFRAVCLGQSWREGNAFVASLDTLLSKHFRAFHHALSKESASPTTLDQLIQSSPMQARGVRIAESFVAQAGRLSNRLSDLMTETFGSVLRDQPEPSREFLEECYSSDPSVDFYAKSLRGLLRDPVPVFSSDVVSVRPGHKKDPFGKAISALMDRQGIRPPIVVIGGKGFGKTTFLQWFLKASSFHAEIEKQIVLWVDFRPVGYPAACVEQEVRCDLIRQLENSSALSLNTFGGLKQVFHERLSLEKKRFLAPYAGDQEQLDRKTAELIQAWQQDSHGYLLALVRYAIDHCKKRVVIILDNSDHKTSEFQIAVYNAAQQLATALPATVVVALRESTFYRLCKMPQGDAFSQQQVFHIRAPNIHSVLGQRFAFLSKHLPQGGATLQSASGAALSIANIGQFLDLLRRSLLDGRDSHQILEMLAALSNGSVRESLNLLHEFLVSGHTKMEDYIWQYAVNSTSTIPFHEFLASVMLDEMAFFREEYSHTFVNLFARSAAPGDSHFTRLRLLSLVRAMSPGNEFRPDDYVRLSTVKARLIAVGVPDASFDAHMQTLIRFGLIQADTLTALDDPGGRDADYGNVAAVHITAAGQYYLDQLAGAFQYLQRVAPDVPIDDEAVSANMANVFAPFKARPSAMPVDRGVRVVMLLMEYLGKKEDDEHNGGRFARDPILSATRFTESMRIRVQPEVEAISRSAQKGTPKPNN